MTVVYNEITILRGHRGGLPWVPNIFIGEHTYAINIYAMFAHGPNYSSAV